MRHGLRVVPHVGAGTVAAAGVRETAFPSPYVAVFLAQNGGRFQDGEIGGDRIEHVGRQSGGRESFLNCTVRARKDA